MTVRWSATFDCHDAKALAAFWSLALGYTEKPPPPPFASWEEWLAHYDVPEDEWNDGAALHDPEGVLPHLSFLAVPEAKSAKNRLHIDVQVGGGRDATPWEERWPRVEAHVELLVRAGATVIRVNELRGRPDGVVMADPEGNEFCVI